MTDACRPADGAEDGSLHWVCHDRFGNRVWVWKGRGHWEPFLPAVQDKGWRYIGPASPSDAADLAAARTEVKALKSENTRLRADRAFWKGQAKSSGVAAAAHFAGYVEQKAQSAALTAANEAMREACEWAQSCIIGDDCDDPDEARRDTLSKLRAALAQSSAGEVKS